MSSALKAPKDTLKAPKDTLAASKGTPTDTLALIPLDRLEKHSSILRMLSIPLRVRILDFLDTSGKPQHVSAIVEQCEDASPAMISQHLSVLKGAGLVDSERDRKRVFYRIVDPTVQEYLALLRISAQKLHISAQELLGVRAGRP